MGQKTIVLWTIPSEDLNPASTPADGFRKDNGKTALLWTRRRRPLKITVFLA